MLLNTCGKGQADLLKLCSFSSFSGSPFSTACILEASLTAPFGLAICCCQIFHQAVSGTRSYRESVLATCAGVPPQSPALLSPILSSSYQGAVKMAEQLLSANSMAGQEASSSPNKRSSSRREEVDQMEQGFSDDDLDLVPYPPPFTGLFHPVLFKSLLHKATSQIGTTSATPVEPLGPQVSDKAEISELIITQENIPCPRFFLETPWSCLQWMTLWPSLFPPQRSLGTLLRL
ncbi:hypothetical protein L345_06904, partial [Ophiophagus hannah]